MRHCFFSINVRRMLALLFAVVILASAVPYAVAAEASGSCGGALSWELNDGTLTITGSGKMDDFREDTPAPWNKWRDTIEQLVISDGITSVGDFAFLDCDRLMAVSIPDSVLEIGEFAFARCTGIVMLDLGNGVHTIQDGGFRECVSLTALRLPDSLIRIGYQGFYRCESLYSVVIPSSVQEMGMNVFGYCSQLVQVEVDANLTVLPGWSFYGCESLANLSLPDSLVSADDRAFTGCTNLVNVEYHGNQQSAEQIQNDIMRDTAQSDGYGIVGEQSNGNSASSSTLEDYEDYTESVTSSAVQTDNASMGSNITNTLPHSGGGASSSANVTITIENENGWKEILEDLTNIVDRSDFSYVDIFVKDDTLMPSEVMDALTEKNVTVSVQTQNGSKWEVDFSEIVVDQVEGDFDLSYERVPASEEQSAMLGGVDSYQVKFDNDVQVNADVMIKLPVSNAKHNAFLYQVKDGKLEKLQSSIVDHQGYAHFYLANVDSETEYLVGIDVPGEDTSNIIVPKTVKAEFDITDTLAPMDYVITGRKSSWGMEIGQVTWIMAGVLIGSVVLIGIVLYVMNKRKLKKGYVVDLDEYELN